MITYEKGRIFLFFALSFWWTALNANNERAPQSPPFEENSALQLRLENYQATIDEIKASHGEFSIQLLEPLQGAFGESLS